MADKKMRYLTDLLKTDMKDKIGANEDIDEFLKKHNIELIHPDHNEQKLLSDTPDDELEQTTLYSLTKIVQKRASLIKQILNKQTLKTKKPCSLEIEGIEQIS